MSPNCWNVLGISPSSTIATCYLGQRILGRVSCALEMNNRISTHPYSKLPLGVKEGTDFFFLCVCVRMVPAIGWHPVHRFHTLLQETPVSAKTLLKKAKQIWLYQVFFTQDCNPGFPTTNARKPKMEKREESVPFLHTIIECKALGT